MVSNYSKKFVLALLTAILPICVNAQLGLYAGENVPITFYGKLLDQNAQPVVAAKLSVQIVITHYAINGGEQKDITVETDQNGDFNITGVSGHAIHISSIEKNGYELSSKSKRDFSYGLPHNIPDVDPKRPVIFRMWKSGPTEPLVGTTKAYAITSDGKPFTINLLTQEVKPGVSGPGDIIVRITRPQKLPPRTKYDWSYSIEAIDGGVLHTNSDFLYQAPETGYEARYEFSAHATNAQWFGGVRGEQFFVKTRGGQTYGRLVVEVIPEHKDGSIFKVEYAVNPAGSRNLER